MKPIFPQRALLIVSTLSLLFTFSGCGSSDGPELGEVHGQVLIDGKLLPKAVVRFQPTAGAGTYSTAVTNDDGEYRLQFSRTARGALVGTHAVWISTADQDAEDDLGNSSPISEIVPARYNVETELVREVAPGENVIDFQLENSVRQAAKHARRR